MDKKARANELLNLMAMKNASLVKPTGLSFYRPQPSDTIIATYPKAGTTLLQNLVYQVVVATGGGLPFDPDGTNFSDICAVVPWVDFGPQFGVMECPTRPRVFKTHSCASEFDLNKSKFIYCIRDPLRYPGSMLDFWFEVTTGENIQDVELRKEIFDEYVRRALLGCPPSDASKVSLMPAATNRYGTWFTHVQGWTRIRRENVLVLFYEEVTADIGRTATNIARFMDRTLSTSAIDTIVQRCSRKAMTGDSKFESLITSRGLGLGDVQVKYVLPEDRKGFCEFSLDASSMNAYRQKLQETFGVDSYDAFRDVVHRKQLDAKTMR